LVQPAMRIDYGWTATLESHRPLLIQSRRNVLLACGALGKVSIVREPLRNFVVHWQLLVG